MMTGFHERTGKESSPIPASTVMSPQEVVEASPGALGTDEVICNPLLEDPQLVHNVQGTEFITWEQSTGGPGEKIPERSH